jgi:hypothetical protein
MANGDRAGWTRGSPSRVGQEQSLALHEKKACRLIRLFFALESEKGRADVRLSNSRSLQRSHYESQLCSATIDICEPTSKMHILRGLVYSLLAAKTLSSPNFIFILTDDQDVLLNGTSAMPVLQREFIQKGLSFNGFVDVPVCCPSRTSTLTGRYSHNLNNTELGWCGNYGRTHEGHTWIRTLREAGYQVGGKLQE